MFEYIEETRLQLDYRSILEKELMNTNIGLERIFKIVPELKEMLHYKENHSAHKFNILEHTLKVIKGVPDERILKLAALFHDIGKPYQKIEAEDGVNYFWGRREVGEMVSKELREKLGYVKYINEYRKDNYLLGHEEIGKLISEDVMTRLEYSDHIINSVTRLVLFHDYIISPNENEIRFAVKKIGEDIFDSLLVLQEADILAHAEHFIARKLPLLKETKKLYEKIKKQSNKYEVEKILI